jgi:hypothetical protein
LKWPRTLVTIMCRAQNPAAVCPGSKNHFAMALSFPTDPRPGGLQRRRRLRSTDLIFALH